MSDALSRSRFGDAADFGFAYLIASVIGSAYTVFTNGTICAHGYCHILQVHTQVQVAGITISPNDLLHGDCNGVTTIPKEIAADVADVGDEFMSAEAVTLEALRHNPTLAQFAAARSEASAMITKLRKRIKAEQMESAS